MSLRTCVGREAARKEQDNMALGRLFKSPFITSQLIPNGHPAAIKWGSEAVLGAAKFNLARPPMQLKCSLENNLWSCLIWVGSCSGLKDPFRIFQLDISGMCERNLGNRVYVGGNKRLECVLTRWLAARVAFDLPICFARWFWPFTSNSKSLSW